jgi:exonuclease VII small subunit
MKLSKYYILPILLFASTPLVQAQTEPESAQTNVAEQRAQIQENVEERKATLTERLQKRITNLAANMSNRFDRVIERLQNIINRVDSRIAKLNTEGKDTTEAKASLDRAQTSLNQAKVTVSNIDADVQAVVGSPEPKTAWQNLKATYLLSKELLKTTHSELRTAISLLKNNSALTETANETGSSTSETTE